MSSPREAVPDPTPRISLADVRCKKPHDGYKPVNTLTLDGLPEPYRSEEWLDFIKYEAVRTVKLEIPFVSPYRPKSFSRKPGRQYGTGRIKEVDLRTERTECLSAWEEEDSEPLFIITTANHVVCGQDEVEKVICYVNYNDDHSKVYIVRGLQLITDLKSKDACEFTCMADSIDDAKEIRKLLQSKQKPGKAFSSAMFSISHPHGSAKMISFGEIRKKTPKFGGKRYTLLLKACKQNGIQEIKKIMFFYISEILKNKPEDIGNARLISLLKNHETRARIINSLEQSEYVKKTSEDEFILMDESLKTIENDIKREAHATFESIGASNPVTQKKKDWFLKGYENDIVQSFDERLEQYTLFESVQKEVLNQIKQCFNEKHNSNVEFSDRYKHVTYTVPTCPGSSGASVWHFFEENGVHKRLEAIHRGYDRNTKLNYAHYGHESVV